MNIAAEYLKCLRERDAAEHVLTGALMSVLPGSDFDFAGDDYDASLELFVPSLPVERTAEVGTFVLSLGFARCWVHRHEGQRDKCNEVMGRCDREHYFSISGAP